MMMSREQDTTQDGDQCSTVESRPASQTAWWERRIYSESGCKRGEVRRKEVGSGSWAPLPTGQVGSLSIEVVPAPGTGELVDCPRSTAALSVSALHPSAQPQPQQHPPHPHPH